MNSNTIMSSLISVIDAQLALIGITDFDVSQNFQPSDQYTGGDKDSEFKTKIFLHSITNPVIGRGRKYSTDSSQRADTQHLSKVIQVSVVHYFDYADVNAYTPEDMAATVRALLDSPDAIKALRDLEIYLQEVGEVRPVFTVNDKDQNESVPNFDLVINYQSDIIKISGVVNDASGEVGVV